jgi:trimeric autotransporter adhesin
VASVALSAPARVLRAGGSLQLVAVARDAAGNPLNPTISWSSSAADVATVDAQGLVRGVRAGAATITASSGGRSGTLTLGVRDTATLGATLSGRIARVDIALPAGATYRATADLVLIADSTLTVAGTLEVVPGVAVALIANRVTVSGTIEPVPDAS